MLKKKDNCKVCQALDRNPKLVERIYKTTHYDRTSELSLAQMTTQLNEEGHDVSYGGLLNHVKKHQYMSEKDFNARHLRRISNEAEKKMLRKKLDSLDVWDDIIEVGMEKVKNGEMSVKAGDLLRAAKDKSDFHLKKQDQELKLAEMVFFFASGANKQELSKPYDRRIIEGKEATDLSPADGTTEDLGGGTDGPSAVHYPPSWDAST